MCALPLTPTAMQNGDDDDKHDTPAGLPMLIGVLHALPLYVSAFPLQSIATQNGDGDDTQDKPPMPSGSVVSAGVVHELPL